MLSDKIKITYIGGPTAMLEIGGLRFLTDPTFDPAGTDYHTTVYTLHKSVEPAIHPKDLGNVDYVLLSHDHHFDNLDHAGRNFLSQVKTVYTTPDGAARLGKNTVGLKNWQMIELPTRDNHVLQITGTPCRHGPEHGDRGPVTGFVLQYQNEDDDSIYISGDT
ncbi:MAG: MBL fold metallo-hydrolase, partial [Chitinophagaceae bacterium]